MDIEIEVGAVKQLIDDDAEFLLLDCREQEEWDLVHIDGALLIPMSEIQQRVEELTMHKDGHIVVQCHHGGRSLQVAHWLKNQGFDQAQSMRGGIDVWSQAIDSSLPRY
ncbi:MAG: rhodanese-like domain-containing protein [Pirellulaceae bacterium]